MNRLLVILFVVFAITGARAQEFPFSSTPSAEISSASTIGPQTRLLSPVFRKDFLSVKRSTFRIPGERMKKTGRTLTLLGGAMLIGGIAVYSAADKTVKQVTYMNSNGTYVTYDEVDPQVTLGVLMMVGGVGMSIPGVIIWKKGVKKYNRYMEEQQQLSLDIRGPQGAIVYRF